MGAVLAIRKPNQRRCDRLPPQKTGRNHGKGKVTDEKLDFDEALDKANRLTDDELAQEIHNSESGKRKIRLLFEDGRLYSS